MLFKPRLVSAGTEVHQQLLKWIAPINADASNLGLENNRAATVPRLQYLQDEALHKIIYHNNAGNVTCFTTQVALEQDADAIFLIAGYHRGFDIVIGPATERDQAEFARRIKERDYIEQLAKHNLERPIMQGKVNAKMAAINAQRKAKGEPPRVLGARYGIYSMARELGLNWTTNHPGHGPQHTIFADREVSKYFDTLLDQLYRKKRKPVPSVNVILFLAGDENYHDDWEKSLKKYVRFFGGKQRIIRGLDEIKSAR
jgi:hypothetical protein